MSKKIKKLSNTIDKSTNMVYNNFDKGLTGWFL